MTLGEKISKLRKENNYTQEQLAEILDVSRQAISRWESDIAYPETEKLIRMGKLFDCSMDYLLKEECTDVGAKNSSDASATFFKDLIDKIKAQFRERKSEKTLLGLPLYHIGRDAKGFFAIGVRARGVIAVGLRARGVLSLGLLSVGVLSVGLLSLGLVSLGVLSLGAAAVGSIALGIISIGALCIGLLSIGALSVGCFSVGALAVGKYIAIGDYARAMIAIGDTSAIGEIYRHIGTLMPSDISHVKALLSNTVPRWLSWAAQIAKMFI